MEGLKIFCEVVSSLAAFAMLWVSYKIHKMSEDTSKKNVESEHYFENVVLYAMKSADETKEKIKPVIDSIVAKNIRGTRSIKSMQADVDTINGLFFDFRNGVRSRLTIFNVEIEESRDYWENFENQLTHRIGNIKQNDSKLLYKDICILFDNSILAVKQKDFSI